MYIISGAKVGSPKSCLWPCQKFRISRTSLRSKDVVHACRGADSAPNAPLLFSWTGPSPSHPLSRSNDIQRLSTNTFYAQQLYPRPTPSRQRPPARPRVSQLQRPPHLYPAHLNHTQARWDHLPPSLTPHQPHGAAFVISAPIPLLSPPQRPTALSPSSSPPSPFLRPHLHPSRPMCGPSSFALTLPPPSPRQGPSRVHRRSTRSCRILALRSSRTALHPPGVQDRLYRRVLRRARVKVQNGREVA